MYKSFLVLILLTFLFSCQSQTEPDNEASLGKISMQMDISQAPIPFVSIEGMLTRPNYETIYFDFSIPGPIATAVVEGLAQGTWHLQVDALNGQGNTLYSGATDVNITAGQVTPVHLQLNPATGSLEITVSWNTVQPEVIYSNTFESPADTAEWMGWLELSNDTPHNGGLVSVRVSGGCMHPHVYLMFEGIDQPGSVYLKAQAKNLANGGTINLQHWGDSGNDVFIHVKDSSWQEYTSEQTLQVMPNDTLMLSMSAGGIVYSAMLVDNLQIIWKP